MNTNTESLYELIHRSVTPEGSLPESFSLPKPDQKGVRFADGARDGIAIFHTNLAPDDVRLLEEAVQAAALGNDGEARRLAAEFCENGRMITSIDGIQDFIISHKDNLNPEKLHHFAVQLALEGTQPEEVKLGLSLLELFNTNPEGQLKEAIRELALSDEFTLFCLFIMRSWDNPAQEIFRVARKTDGWGRIHAVERLEPENEEIELWLLEHGWNNTVLPAYSALECFQKTHYTARLSGDMSPEQYRGAAGLMSGLLDEGPVRGISACENPEEVLLAFLSQSRRQPLKASDYPVIADIRDYAWEHKLTGAATAADELLKSASCLECLESAMKCGENLRLAKRLGLDYVPHAFYAIEEHFQENCHLVDLLMDDEKNVDRLIPLFEAKLPLDSIASGSADEMGLGQEFKDHQALGYMVQHLRAYPDRGTALVRAALRSPVVSNRNMALNVLEDWTKAGQQPFKLRFPELSVLLKEAAAREVRDDVRGRMESLLEA